MLYAELKGGLGNQMFQYALARHIAMKLNMDMEFELSWFNRQSCGGGDLFC